MDRISPSASIEPLPVTDFAKWTLRFPFEFSTAIRSLSRTDAAPIKRIPCSSRAGEINACPFANGDLDNSMLSVRDE